MLAELQPGTTIAGTFTRSKTRSAPVLDCEVKLGREAQAGAAILVNSGNSNAFTGTRGVEAVRAVAAQVATTLGIPEARVFTSSTGVIGEPLPHERITAVIETLHDTLSGDGIADAARAIMTTDTYPKGSVRTAEIGGRTVTVAGIAKGSGMIAPDMGTMLVYVFTDARIGFDALQPLVKGACDSTFNCITVDSDTSTSDTLLVAATGASGIDVTDNPAFSTALTAVMDDLAKQVVRDGEGATKFVAITVTGAASARAARRIGLAIANSPLVKTAIAGEDANWGRIVMAVGKSGEPADREKIAITIGGYPVAQAGSRVPGYDEGPIAEHMKGEEIDIAVDVGMGNGTATVWTCDLTHGYVDINGAYRT
jgi:glutamate N-acetyltransferase/amino-acid N-acetyltransferase